MESKNRNIYSGTGYEPDRRDIKEETAYRRREERSARPQKQYFLYGLLSVVTLLLAAGMFLVASLLCSVQFPVYMRLVFIPLFSFAACFVNCLMAEKCKWMPAVVLAICAVSFLIFCSASLSVFPHLLLYVINGAIGFLIARLVNSYNKK